MRIVSLFSGFGIFDAGLELAGVGHVVAQVEINAYARQVLTRHWPDAVRFDDVRAVGVANLTACDLICGGFPCTDLSFAGRRAGLDGAESGLWREFARIIREVRPRFVVVENVPGLLAPVRAAGIQVDEPAIVHVLGELSACGYDAVWFPVSAADVGAGHERDRMFVVGWRSAAFADSFDGGCESGGRSGRGRSMGSGRDTSDHASTIADASADVADTDRQRLDERQRDARERAIGRTALDGRGSSLADAHEAGSDERAGARCDLDGSAEPANGSQPVASGNGRRPGRAGGSLAGDAGQQQSALQGAAESDADGEPQQHSRECVPIGERPQHTLHRGDGATRRAGEVGDAQSRLVRLLHGRPDRVVAGGFPIDAWRFAASAYAPQPDWEPPRLAPRTKGDHSRQRIEGDGNAVTAQQAFVVGRVVMQIAAALESL